MSELEWRREGYCCRCGECCGPPVVQKSYMLSKITGRCKYLEFETLEDGSAIAICQIKASQTDLENTIKPDFIPEREFNYWVKYCRRYPSDGDFGHHLMPSCTYRQIWKVG